MKTEETLERVYMYAGFYKFEYEKSYVEISKTIGLSEIEERV